MKEIRVKLFGSLREFAGSQADGEIVVSAAKSLPELRQTLALFFRQSQVSASEASDAIEILKDSAFADERSVLAADAELEGRSWIAVLPPVCGG